MARYTGPKTKIARKFGEPIYGPDKAYEKRVRDNKNYPSGQHGAAKKRKKVSEYGTQLKEKEKVKYTYGVLERQFRNLYTEASRMKGIKGVNLIMLLESRLDNIVYRLGIAPTRAAARQLVSHRHIVLNGNVMGVPSAHVKPGDIVGVRERSKSLEVIQEALAASPAHYSWLEWNAEKLEGKFLNLPDRTEIPENINEQLIVELYSK
ncbi:MAG: 30S ribosomal protein S4 [Bacteroidales bacterium]|nr:30S ribosomal protein S4 [Bacteroidales bacterium]